MVQSRFCVTGVQKVLESFKFVKPPRRNIKVLNCIIDIYGRKYFRTFLGTQRASFLKKSKFFLNWQYFSSLQTTTILKNELENTSKVKVMLNWTVFLIFLTLVVI